MLTQRTTYCAYRTSATLEEYERQLEMAGSFLAADQLPGLVIVGDAQSCRLELETADPKPVYERINAFAYAHREFDHVSIRFQYRGNLRYGQYLIGGKYIGSFLVAIGIYKLVTSWSWEAVRGFSIGGYLIWFVLGIFAFNMANNGRDVSLYPSELSEMIDK